MGYLDATPDTREGWATDADALRGLANSLERDGRCEWANPEWLRELARKIQRVHVTETQTQEPK